MPRISDRPVNSEVTVRHNNVDQALRVLKKKLQREGVYRELKKRVHFITNGEKNRENKARAISRDFKLQVAKMAIADGIPKQEAKKILKAKHSKNKRSPR